MLGSLVAQDVGGNIFTDWVCNNPKSTAAIAIVGTAGIFGASSYFSCKKQQNIAHAPSQASALSEVAGDGKGFTWNIKMVDNAGKVDVQEYFARKNDKENKFDLPLTYNLTWGGKTMNTEFITEKFNAERKDRLYRIPLWEEQDPANFNSVVLGAPTVCLIMEEADMAKFLGEVSGSFVYIGGHSNKDNTFKDRAQSAGYARNILKDVASGINKDLLERRNVKYYITDVYGNILVAIEINWGGEITQIQAFTSDNVTFKITLASVMRNKEYQAFGDRFKKFLELIFQRFENINNVLRGLKKSDKENPLGVPDITQGDCNKIISALKTMVGMN